MDHLPNLIKPFLQFIFGSFESGLAQVDCIRQHRTTGMNALGIAPFRQLDAFGFEKLAKIFVKLVFSNGFHI